MVTVRLFGAARACAGVTELTMPAKSLAQMKGELVVLYPAIAPVLIKCSFLVNEVSQRDMNAPLHNGDTVDVLPPFAGGSA